MATIKSYSDLEQSKKLAEILPLESADMSYQHFVPEFFKEGYCPSLMEKEEDDDILCWSLASLLDILPRRIEFEDVAYELSVYFYGLYYWNVNNDNLLLEVKDKDNFVDACYELILKLNELNLL